MLLCLQVISDADFVLANLGETLIMSVLQKYSKSSIIEESKARQVCGMKDQITLTDVEYGNPKGEHGRPVRGIETMLRMYLMQTWFNLSDEGTEDAIYDSYAMRSFLGINFMTEQVPDATTLLKFRNRRMS